MSSLRYAFLSARLSISLGWSEAEAQVWAKNRSSSEGAAQDLPEWAVFTVDSGPLLQNSIAGWGRVPGPLLRSSPGWCPVPEISICVSLRSKWDAGKAVGAGLAVEGAYLNGYVTDEQRSRRPIFIATLWAVASRLFFRVARSFRIDSRCARRNRQSGSDRLEKQPTDLRRNICLFRGQDTTMRSRLRRLRERIFCVIGERNRRGETIPNAP